MEIEVLGGTQGSCKSMVTRGHRIMDIGLVCLFETGFLCVALGCPGTHSVDQAGLELTKIPLPLLPECWD